MKHSATLTIPAKHTWEIKTFSKSLVHFQDNLTWPFPRGLQRSLIFIIFKSLDILSLPDLRNIRTFCNAGQTHMRNQGLSQKHRFATAMIERVEIPTNILSLPDWNVRQFGNTCECNPRRIQKWDPTHNFSYKYVSYWK